MKLNIKRHYWIIMLLSVCLYAEKESESFDVMIDCQYPIFGIQSIREALSQAVYFLQQNNIDQSFVMMQMAISEIQPRHKPTEDDKEFIQAMIDKINDLIDTLENNNRSYMQNLCDQLLSI
ncbi:MAG: hypothetical protein ACXWL2_04440 [Candidatus Chromulinivorax sp.]